MPPQDLHVAVRRPDGRTVTVQIEVQELQHDWAVPLVADEGNGRAFPLDDDDLDSKADLLRFLARITRSAPDGGRVKAVCFEPHADRARVFLGFPSGSGPVSLDVTEG